MNIDKKLKEQNISSIKSSKQICKNNCKQHIKKTVKVEPSITTEIEQPKLNFFGRLLLKIKSYFS